MNAVYLLSTVVCKTCCGPGMAVFVADDAVRGGPTVRTDCLCILPRARLAEAGTGGSHISSPNIDSRSGRAGPASASIVNTDHVICAINLLPSRTRRGAAAALDASWNSATKGTEGDIDFIYCLEFWIFIYCRY